MRQSNSLSRFLTGTAVALVLASPALADSQEEINEITLPAMSKNVERTPEGQQEAAQPKGDNLGDHLATQKILAPMGMDITGGYSLVVTGGGSLYVTDGGDLNLSNGSITGLLDPTMAGHAATKRYVDQKISGIGNGADDLGNHTATQDLNMNGKKIGNLATPSASGEAATKGYVDSAVSGAGDHMGNHTATKNIDAGGFEVINLATPTGPASAVTKQYVDSAVGAGSATGVNNTRKINTGTGLVGGGDLTADRTLSFDTIWGDGRYVQRTQSIGAGDGLTGGGSLAGSPSFSVDSTVVRTSGAQSIAGNKTFTGDLNFSNRRLLNVATPTAASDVATKSYVDAAISGVGSGVDATVVRTFGDQTIDGTKTFTADVFGYGFKATGGGFYGHRWDSAIAPTLSWIDDVHTGIYNPVAGQISFSSNQNEVFRIGGTLATSLVPLNMSNKSITGLAAPVNAADAATKAYVDSKATGGAADNLGNHTATTTLNLANNRITGLATPTGNTDAATKAYVDSVASKGAGGKGDDLGSHMALQALNMNNYQVTGLAAPSAADHAVNKSYVDTAIAAVPSVDGTVVRTFGNQTIGGTKTFSSIVYGDGGEFSARSAGNRLFRMRDENNVTEALLFHQASDNSARLRLYDAAGSGATRAELTLLQDGRALFSGPLSASSITATNNFLGNAGDSAGAPSYSWAADTDTGMYRPGADMVAFSTGGNERLHISSNGIDVKSLRVVNVAPPTGAGDAVNKSYVDTAIAGVAASGVDATVVRTFGTQTIGGSKLFTSTIEADNGNIVLDSDGNRLLWFRNSAGQAKGLVYSDEANRQMKMRLYDPAGSGSVLAQVALLQDGRTISQGKVEAPTFNATSTTEGGFQGIAADTVSAPSFTWTGDTNTGVYKPGNDIVAITTGGVERLRVSSAGVDAKNLKVLNVATPTAGTDGVNKAYVDSAVSGVSGVDATVVRTFGDQTVGGTKTFSNSLITKGGSVYVDSTGSRHVWFRDTAGKNLGILYQDSGAGAMRLRAYDNGAGTGVKSELSLLQDGRAVFTGTTEAPTFNATSTTGGGFQGIGGDTAGAPSFTWTGDLDTGVYRPTTDQVGFSTGGGQRLLLSNTQADFSVTPLFDSGNAILRSDGNRAIYMRNNANAEQALIFHEESTNQLKFFVRNTGNTTWSTSLNIDDNGQIFPGGNGYFSGNGSGLTTLNAGNLSSGTVDPARLPLRNASHGTQGVVEYAGNAPSNARFYGGTTDPTQTQYRMNFAGLFSATRMYSNMYLYFSDERLKDDIQTLSEPMEKIRDLRPVTYSWKQNGEQAMGLIAQEVEVIYPEIVRESGSGFKAVDYTQLISPMLAAIQELDARLTALETKE